MQSLIQVYLLAPEASQDVNKKSESCVHFIETGASVLRSVPWMERKEHKVHACILSLMSYYMLTCLCHNSSWSVIKSKTINWMFEM